MNQQVGLGQQDIDWMKSLIRNIRGSTSVLIVEHHMDVVMSVCDRIYVLNFGELIAEGTPAQVRENPAVVAAYPGTQAGRIMTLVINNLQVKHGAITAIDDLSFTINKGELVTIIGSNGAGKTTLLRALSGLLPISSGEISWNGKSIVGVRAENLVRQGIVHVSEGKAVIPELTVSRIFNWVVSGEKIRLILRRRQQK
jgi:ABC-type branched-subunit amino acid transport system ATPase component